MKFDESLICGIANNDLESIKYFKNAKPIQNIMNLIYESHFKHTYFNYFLKVLNGECPVCEKKCNCNKQNFLEYQWSYKYNEKKCKKLYYKFHLNNKIKAIKDCILNADKIFKISKSLDKFIDNNSIKKFDKLLYNIVNKELLPSRYFGANLYYNHEADFKYIILLNNSYYLLYVRYAKEEYFEFEILNINTSIYEKKTIHLKLDTLQFTEYNYKISEIKLLENNVYVKISKLLIFLLFVEVEEKITYINPPSKKKMFDPKTGLKKLSPLKIINADINYNTTVIHKGQFNVSGHFRLQPCGEGRKKHKLIFINEFVKSGYKRRAKKLLIESEV